MADGRSWLPVWEQASGDGEPPIRKPECNGICLSAADIGLPGYGAIAYPHPDCELHSPDTARSEDEAAGASLADASEPLPFDF